MRLTIYAIVTATASLTLAACGSPSSSPGAQPKVAAVAAPTPPPCDMAETGQRVQPGHGGDPREQALLYQQMSDKAHACATAAGFTDVARMNEAIAGSSRMDAAGIYHPRPEAEWMAIGMRDGARMQIIVTASGVLSATPAAPGAGPH